MDGAGGTSVSTGRLQTAFPYFVNLLVGGNVCGGSLISSKQVPVVALRLAVLSILFSLFVRLHCAHVIVTGTRSIYHRILRATAIRTLTNKHNADRCSRRLIVSSIRLADLTVSVISMDILAVFSGRHTSLPSQLLVLPPTPSPPTPSPPTS